MPRSTQAGSGNAEVLPGPWHQTTPPSPPKICVGSSDPPPSYHQRVSDYVNTSAADDVLQKLPWTGVAEWLRELDIDDDVIRLVEKERVPGSQIAVMTLSVCVCICVCA